NFYDKEAKPHPFATGVDWRLIPAAVLILFALWILAALALTCSTRLDIIPTLTICSAFFLLGLMSDYLFGRRASATASPATLLAWLKHALASVLYSVTPNWQLFWLADALDMEKGKLPWAYVGKAFG